MEPDINMPSTTVTRSASSDITETKSSQNDMSNISTAKLDVDVPKTTEAEHSHDVVHTTQALHLQDVAQTTQAEHLQDASGRPKEDVPAEESEHSQNPVTITETGQSQNDVSDTELERLSSNIFVPESNRSIDETSTYINEAGHPQDAFPAASVFGHLINIPTTELSGGLPCNISTIESRHTEKQFENLSDCLITNKVITVQSLNSRNHPTEDTQAFFQTINNPNMSLTKNNLNIAPSVQSLNSQQDYRLIETKSPKKVSKTFVFGIALEDTSNVELRSLQEGTTTVDFEKSLESVPPIMLCLRKHSSSIEYGSSQENKSVITPAMHSGNSLEEIHSRESKRLHENVSTGVRKQLSENVPTVEAEHLRENDQTGTAENLPNNVPSREANKTRKSENVLEHIPKVTTESLRETVQTETQTTLQESVPTGTPKTVLKNAPTGKQEYLWENALTGSLENVRKHVPSRTSKDIIGNELTGTPENVWEKVPTAPQESLSENVLSGTSDNSKENVQTRKQDHVQENVTTNIKTATQETLKDNVQPERLETVSKRILTGTQDLSSGTPPKNVFTKVPAGTPEKELENVPTPQESLPENVLSETSDNSKENVQTRKQDHLQENVTTNIKTATQETLQDNVQPGTPGTDLENVPTETQELSRENVSTGTLENELKNVPSGTPEKEPENVLTTTTQETSPENVQSETPNTSKEKVPTETQDHLQEQVTTLDSRRSSVNEEQLLLISEEEIPAPLQCPIFRANLEGASITECGHCFCTHCVDQMKGSLYKKCSVCNKTIRSHQLREIDIDSEGIVRSRDETIEELRDNDMKMRQQMNELEEQIKEKDGQNQKIDDELAKAKREIHRLTEERQHLKKYEQLCFHQESQLNEFLNKILPEKENVIAELNSDKVTVSANLQEKENEVGNLREHVEYLEQYVHLCHELQYQLQDLQENIVPQKDQTIVELQRYVEQLIGEINTLKQITVPLSQLEVLPETNLGKAIQQLQQFYDRDYRSRFDITDKMEALLQTRLESVMGELCQNHDIGDQLAKVITTYTSMVRENSNLHRSLKTKQDELQQMKTELRQTKARQSKTKQRISYQTEE